MSNIKSLATPGKYLQGEDLLHSLYKQIQHIGTQFAVIIDSYVKDIIGDRIKKGFEDSDGEFDYIIFSGESTEGEARRIADDVMDKGYHGIIGAGGGKVVDTTKLTGEYCGLPVVIIPTAAASDAPCSARSVIYDENGTFVVSAKMKHNPEVVLVDTKVIAEAPVHLFVAGMGDAYSTFFEARACKRSGAFNFTGGTATEAAYAIADLCRDILLKFGKQAKDCVERKQCSEALEKVTEANIYLSGVGFENNGCAIAHAIYSGMTGVLKPFPVLHGEGVAFGTIVQLAAEYLNSGIWDHDEWNETVSFYQDVGLPLTLKDLGVTDISEALFAKIAEATCNLSQNAHNMPFPVTPKVIYNALFRVDNYFKA